MQDLCGTNVKKLYAGRKRVDASLSIDAPKENVPGITIIDASIKILVPRHDTCFLI